ncbi:Cysteine-rich protein 2-binding protein [Microtus ochrogaster]|uniref:Cysteine-rich protein 2-binding protein n=1 Tax=Microtus ochrogaster TaxID=79684 RepID=A0A8J6GRV2_MICOH|nr:Cysteine-rich protein 2-binding protein [Microtus ochrogaster]
MESNIHLAGLLSRHDDEATRTSTSEGLEEGEVEGETLLIVESEDQASVDLSHDQSGDSLNSDEGDVSWMEEQLSYFCDKCQKWIPASQLREQLSYLKGDNFFRFTCSDCSADGKEQSERLKLTWQQVVMLAMYNLSLEGSGRQGYFRWKEDICAFIEKHWTFLLGNRKKTSTWWSTVAGCLSVGSPVYFRSGAQEFGEPGWWKLVHNRPPTMRPEGEKLSASTLKVKASKPALDPIITVEGLRKRASRNPVESAMELKEKRSRTQEAKDIRRAQKEAAGLLDRSTSSTPVKFISRARRPDMVLEKGEVIDFSSLSSSDRTPLTSPSPSPSLDFSAPGTPASHSATPSLLSEADLIPDVMPPQALFHDDDELEGDGVIDPGMEYIPPPAGSAASGLVGSRKKVRAPEQIKQEVDRDEEKPDRMDGDSEDTDSNASLHTRAREKRKPPLEKDVKPKGPRYTPVSIYEEKLLLKRLEACPSAVAMTPEARRLKRKLIIRQAKRDRGLPLFDLDEVVNAALLLVDGIYGTKDGGASRLPAGQATYRTTCQDFRILDRYQTALPTRKGFRHQTTRFLYRLVGSEDMAVDQSIVSPYTSRILKPYIRSDPHWTPEPDAPLDYCYVRPNHIPTINSMCQEFFWPGIDLSECLQYPDFSVVTCMGKDVTLHVSASNPAMLLYQKFGFKTEEYVLDFYDKYYPLESTECKHAFFLRLRR